MSSCVEVQEKKQPVKEEKTETETITEVKSKPETNKCEKTIYINTQLNDTNVNIVNIYDIYNEENAVAKLSRIRIGENDIALKIQYELPPNFTWGNWLSIRKEFENIIDIGNCNGIEFDLKVVVPSSAKLRLTLSDIVSSKDINSDRDEMWWFDCEDDLIDETKDWITIHAPFENFKISYGAGTRHNDYKMDFSKTIAFEINLTSNANEHPKGVILVKSLRTY